MTTAQPQTDERVPRQSFLLAHRRTLEMIADGVDLREILDELCRTIDAQQPDVISSVLLADVDGKQLLPAAGPHLPDEWTKKITPLPIGANVGACGTAAFLKQTVIVSDIASDPLFDLDDYRSEALRHGLRAAWSQPLISKEGKVLGTFGLYYKQPRIPTAADLQLIEETGQIARIAIESANSRLALQVALEDIRRSEARLQQIVDVIPQTITVLDAEGTIIYANQAVLDYTGLTVADVMRPDFRERIFHPEDIERLREERKQALLRGLPFENEQRARGQDGTYRWFLIRYKPLRDENGETVRWYVSGTNIEDLKRTEGRMRKETLALREEIDRASMFEEIVGSSNALQRVLAQVTKVAPTDSTVLILGETGTGKELIARAIHKRSKRAAGAFIAVNCAAIPPPLIASELFGHEKGAFTGAHQRQLGRFESADGGTIFLDEVGELPVDTQIALLRVLQEKTIQRVGSSQSTEVDIRVLSATNRDLEAAIDAGRFRRDLFYRLNVFPIEMPTLRERSDDIPLLVEYLIDRYTKAAGKKIRRMERKTLELFQAYDWPGNVRELQNVVERAVILSEGDTFSVDETWFAKAAQKPTGSTVPFTDDLFRRERELIESALRESKGKVSGPSGAAAKLGIPRQTLDSRIKALGIDKYLFKTR